MERAVGDCSCSGYKESGDKKCEYDDWECLGELGLGLGLGEGEELR